MISNNAKLPAEAGLHNARLSVTFAGESGESTVGWDQLAAPLVLPAPYRCILERRGGEIVLSRWPSGADRDSAVEFSRIDVRKIFLEGAMIRVPEQDAAADTEPRSYFVNIRPEDMCPGSGVFTRPAQSMPRRPARERTLTWIRSAKIRKLNATLNGKKVFASGGGIMRARTIVFLFALSASIGFFMNHGHKVAPSETAAAVAPDVAIEAVAARPAIESVHLPDPRAVAAAKVHVGRTDAYRAPAASRTSFMAQVSRARPRVMARARKQVLNRAPAKARKAARKSSHKQRTRVADARELESLRKTN